jgi:hypothetical protein
MPRFQVSKHEAAAALAQAAIHIREADRLLNRSARCPEALPRIEAIEPTYSISPHLADELEALSDALVDGGKPPR